MDGIHDPEGEKAMKEALDIVSLLPATAGGFLPASREALHKEWEDALKEWNEASATGDETLRDKADLKISICTSILVYLDIQDHQENFKNLDPDLAKDYLSQKIQFLGQKFKELERK